MKRIILIGMPLSGKTTLGKKLAKKLKYDFIDTDKLIEKEENKSIENIFKNKGEEYFRYKETKVLDTIAKNNVVISTGGGTPIFNNNMKKLNNMGVTIFLKVSLEKLKLRNKKSKIERPLFKKDEDFKLHYNNRKKYYNEAQIIIENEGNINEIIDKIIKEYNNITL